MNESKPAGLLQLIPYSESNITTGSSVTNSSHFGNETAEHVIAISLMCVSAYLATVSFFYCNKHSIVKLRKTDSLISVATVMLFFECCWFEIEIAITHHSMSFCTAYTVVNVAIATTIRIIIYVILWLRQQCVYNGPLLQDNRKASIISKITLVGILTFGFSQIILLSITPQHPVDGGCVSEKLSPEIKILVPLVFSLSSGFQLVLLGLTIYPVIQQIKEGTIASSKDQLKTIAARLCICTSICTFVDLLFIAIIQRKPSDAPISFIPICYAFNTVVNTTTTLCSFVNYKQRLWPFGGASSAGSANQVSSFSSNSKPGANSTLA